MQMSGAFFGVGPQIKLPIGVTVTAGYITSSESSSEEMNSTTKSAAINRDASVHCYLEPISPRYAYQVQPFVWYAQSTGSKYLKVDYTAQPGYYPGVASWWQKVYSKPDPTFNMPWWWSTFTTDRTMLTKEITSVPAFPKLGQVVQVSVTVRNKALVQASNVAVSLWRGDPDNCLELSCLFAGHTLSTSSPLAQRVEPCQRLTICVRLRVSRGHEGRHHSGAEQERRVVPVQVRRHQQHPRDNRRHR